MITARRLLLLLVCLFAGPPAHAADLVVLSAAAMKTVLTDIAAPYMAQSGDRLRFVFGTAGVIRDKAREGGPFDLVVIPPAPLAELVKANLVKADSTRALGLVRLGAAVRSQTPHPEIATPDVFRQTLLAAPSIGLADPTTGATSGIYLVHMLEQIGILEQIRPRLHLYPEGQTAMEAAARGEIAFGLGQISEIKPVAGVDLLGPIPVSLQLKTIYAVGLATQSPAPDAAARFLSFLRGPQGQAVLAAQGFEQPPS